MIRCGNEADIPELKRLWKVCFEDEDNYINDFFETFYQDENILLTEENGMLAGASFFLPGKLCCASEKSTARHKHDVWGGVKDYDYGWQDIRYVYALASYPKHRGRGIAGGLLRHAYAHYHAPLIVEPAEEGLVWGFYEPLGFRASFYWKQIQIQMPQYDLRAAQAYAPGQHWHIRQIDAQMYCQMRDRCFCRYGYVGWPPRHAAFAVRQHEKSGGGAFLAEKEGREGILLYYREKEQIAVTETTLEQEEITEIFADDTCRQLAIRAASDTGSLAGMIYGLPAIHGYFNLSLD